MESSNLETVVAVALFLAGMFWSDYSKRGARQTDAGVTLAQLDTRLRAVEAHGDTISKIDPLEAKFDAFKNSMEAMATGLQNDMRNLATSVNQLAVAVATRRT